MTHKVDQRLSSSEVYDTAVGMFLSMGYECLHTIKSNSQNIPELGRVFQKDGQTHVLYFPGRDSDHPFSYKQTTIPLSEVIAEVDSGVDAFLISKKSVENASTVEKPDEDNLTTHINTHMIVCENNRLIPFFRRNHFAYLNSEVGGHYDFYDSMRKRLFFFLTYDLTPIKNILFPQYAHGFGTTSLATNYLGIQKGDWECGYYALLCLEKCMNGEAVKGHLPKVIDQEQVQRLSEFYTLGYEKTHPKASENTDERVIALDDSDDLTETSSHEHRPLPSPVKQATPSFGQTHRKTKYALIGLGIGLGVFAVGVGLIFAWPVVLGAVGGLIAAHIAVGALATTTVGWLGVGALGVAAAAISTGVSLLGKWIKDKMRGDKPVVVKQDKKPASLLRRSSTAEALARQAEAEQNESQEKSQTEVSGQPSVASEKQREVINPLNLSKDQSAALRRSGQFSVPVPVSGSDVPGVKPDVEIESGVDFKK